MKLDDILRKLYTERIKLDEIIASLEQLRSAGTVVERPDKKSPLKKKTVRKTTSRKGTKKKPPNGV